VKRAEVQQKVTGQLVVATLSEHKFVAEKRGEKKAVHQPPSGYRFTTRVLSRIMNRPAGFSTIAASNAARARASVQQIACRRKLDGRLKIVVFALAMVMGLRARSRFGSRHRRAGFNRLIEDKSRTF